MSAGHRSARASAAAPPGARVLLSSALLASALLSSALLGGCAGGEVVAERTAERQATLDRWTRCIERRHGASAPSEVRTRLARRCEGHRRDVLRAFPPHMQSRLERLMNDRTEVMLRTRAREEGARPNVEDPRLRRVLDALSPG